MTPKGRIEKNPFDGFFGQKFDILAPKWLLTAAEQMRADLEDLHSRLAVREAELATSTRRADEAEAATQKIVDAIRTQLLVKLSVPTE